MEKNDYNLIKKLTDEFCIEMEFPPSEYCVGVANNGIKKPESILSKVEREIYSGKPNFTIGAIRDLSRGALILDSYSLVPDALQKLINTYPTMVGKISRQPTGYIGIHLNYEENNIPVEIQISTICAWLVKQATEHGYQKHREFEDERPFYFKKICEEQDESARAGMINEFICKNEDFERDYEKMKILYEKLHQNTDLYENLPTIEAILLSLHITREKQTKKSFFYDSMLTKKLIDSNGKVLKDLVLNNAIQIAPIANEVQKSLINNLSVVYNAISSQTGELTLTPLQQFIFSLRQIINNYYQHYIKKYGDEELSANYSHFVDKFVNEGTIKSCEYAKENNIVFDSITAEEFFELYQKKLIDENRIILPELLLSSLKEEINKNKKLTLK